MQRGARGQRVGEVALLSGGQIVHDVDLVAPPEELVDEVRADESGAAGHECAHGGECKRCLRFARG